MIDMRDSTINENKNRELFNVLTNNLFFFDKFCEKHSLSYYAFAGTLLGAIRHMGIIPWDDDIDVCMLRKDYDKLLNIIDEEKLEHPYEFLSPQSENAFHKGFIRLTNIDTTEIPIKDAVFDYNHGIFIDIFPLDAIVDNKLLFKIQLFEMKILMNLLYMAGRFFGNVGTKGLGLKKKIAYFSLYPFFKLKIFTTRNIFFKYNKIASRYSTRNTKRIGAISFMFDNERFIYNRSDYLSDTILCEFENGNIRIPKEYDSILRKTYGEYMIPVKGGSVHGRVIFDTKTPYKEYVKKNRKKLEKMWLENRDE